MSPLCLWRGHDCRAGLSHIHVITRPRKTVVLSEHQASFLTILRLVLKCPDKRKESWRRQMRHRWMIYQYSCPSFEKSNESKTEIPTGNSGCLPLFFPLSSFSFCLPVPAMANLHLNKSRLFVTLWNACLCTETVWFPSCLLVESFHGVLHPYPDPNWAITVGPAAVPVLYPSDPAMWPREMSWLSPWSRSTRQRWHVLERERC